MWTIFKCIKIYNLSKIVIARSVSDVAIQKSPAPLGEGLVGEYESLVLFIKNTTPRLSAYPSLKRRGAF
jgi:hypothetical protein